MASTILQLLLIISMAILFCYGQTGPQVTLSASEQQQIVSLHNQLRFAVNAQTMPALVWQDSINLWPTNPNNCAFDHTDQTFRSNKGGFSYIGENLAWSSANTDVPTFMSGWASEKSLYVYGPITLDNYGNVGHYTQEVWSATTAIGCSKFNCTLTSTGGYLFVCNYGSGGNYLNQYPYLQCSSPPCATGPASSPSSAASASSAASLSNTPSKTSVPSASTTSTTSRSTTASATHTSAASLSPSPSFIPSTSSSISTSNSNTRTAAASVTSAASNSPSASPPAQCVPSTCSAGRCGNAPNGCGGALSCGTCSPSTSRCVNYQCVACTPSTTCSGKQCGTINDGCGNTLSCGTCTTGSTCNNNTCVVTPVCLSCSQSNVSCGTITPTNCPKLDCGTCSAGNTCSYGRCVSTPCVPACGNKGTCVASVCNCLNGYSDKGDGNGCTPIPSTPFEFSEVYPVPVSTSNWVYTPSDNSTISPELDMIATDNTVFHKLGWNNASQYASLELTKFSAQVKIYSPSTIVGLGLRYGQGNNRNTDAIQYQVEPVSTDGSGNVRWDLIWSNTALDYQIQGNSPAYSVGTWHTLQLNLWNANYSSVTWAVSEVYVDSNLITRQLAVRPYPTIGGAYLYTQGQSSWKNITMATRTTLRVSVSNCLSSSAWAQMVANALGIPSSSVTLVNVSDSTGRCVGQSTGKRQSTLGSEFIFTIESVPDAGSQALASQYVAFAEEWNPYFADAGGILSTDYMPSEYVGTVTGNANDVAEFYDFTTFDPLAAGAGGTGLGAGAIAGIVIGSVVGAIILAALIVAVVAVIIAAVVIARRRQTSTVVDASTASSSQEKTSPPPHSEAGTPVSTPGRKGVDVYGQGDPDSKRKSITGRIPSGYTPRAGAEIDNDNV